MFSHQHHVNLKRISMDDGKGDLLSGSIRNLRHVSCLDHAITPTFERLGLTSCHFTLPCQAEVLQRENSRLPLSFNYRTRVRSLFTLVTNSLTNWLTHSLPISKLDWCEPGMWRWQLKTCWSCFSRLESNRLTFFRSYHKFLHKSFLSDPSPIIGNACQ